MMNESNGDTNCRRVPRSIPWASVGVALALAISLAPDVEASDLALGGGQSPSIAVSPADPSIVAVASKTELRISTDGGNSFGNPILSTVPVTHHQQSSGGSGEPDLAFDSQGRLFWSYVASWTGVDGFPAGQDVFLLEVNPTTGAVVGGPYNITELAGHGVSAGENSAFTGHALGADATVGSPFQDRLYLAWTNFPGGGSQSRAAHSTDRGASWTAVGLGGTNSQSKGGHTIDVAPNGDVYVAAHRIAPSGGSGRHRVDRSTDGGLTFSNSLAFGAGDADVTENFQDDTATAIPGCRSGTFPGNKGKVLADPITPGRVYVVTMDDPDNDHTTSEAADVFIAISSDFGATWSSPMQVDSGPANTFQIFPTAAIDPSTGLLTVAWWDNRNGQTNADGNYLYDVYAAFSTDGGNTFSSDFQINENSFDPEAGSQCWAGCAGFHVALWGSGASDAWTGGTVPSGGTPPLGNATHWDGATWTVNTTGGPAVYALWGSSSSDVFAGGISGNIHHWDGAAWSAMTSPTSDDIAGLWGSSGSDVFGVGANGVIVHYDGASWSTHTSGTSVWLNGVWGSGATDVFAVGSGGTILHYDGTWSSMTSGTGEYLTRVWGTSASSVWAISTHGNVFHYDGSSWSMQSDVTNESLFGLWGTSDTDVWVSSIGGQVGHWDGSDWSVEKITEGWLLSLWGSGSSDVRSVGIQYYMYRYDGFGWAEEDDALGPRQNLTLHAGDGFELAAAGGRIHGTYVGNGLDVNGDAAFHQTYYIQSVSTAAPEVGNPSAGTLVLERSRPNPFQAGTEISFVIPADAAARPVKLVVYDAAGRRVRTLLDAPRGEGRHAVRWDGTDADGHSVAAGIYFGRLEWNGQSHAERIVRLR